MPESFLKICVAVAVVFVLAQNIAKKMLFAQQTFLVLDEKVSKEVQKQIESNGGTVMWAMPQAAKVITKNDPKNLTC